MSFVNINMLFLFNSFRFTLPISHAWAYTSIYQQYMGLHESLVRYRRTISMNAKKRVPDVLCDETFRDIVASKPQTMLELAKMSRITEQQMREHGESILRIVQRYVDQQDRYKKWNVVLGEIACTPNATQKAKPPAVVRGQAYLAKNDVALETVSVYILELQNGKYYVGKSTSVAQRALQHLHGKGSAWTQKYKPTGKMMPRLGTVQDETGDATERDETLRYMQLKGIENVRGWRYTSVKLSEDDLESIRREMNELFNRCRKCGGSGHFARQCGTVMPVCKVSKACQTKAVFTNKRRVAKKK